MVIGDHERCQWTWRGWINYSEDNYKNFVQNSQFGWFTDLRNVFSYSYVEAISARTWVVHNNQGRHYEQSDYSNRGWFGVKQLNCILDFDRDNTMQVQFIWTGTDYIGGLLPWHNQNHTPI